MLFAANIAIWSEIESQIEDGQKTYLALKQAPFPVVSAPLGMAFAFLGVQLAVFGVYMGASFAPNPAYFDPENIVKLAIEGGCNAVASTLGVLGSVARRYAHKIPFIVKFNRLLRF